MEGTDQAIPSAAQTSLVESLLYYYDDYTASSSTVVITFPKSAAVSSYTSEDSWFEEFPAAATTTATAQTGTTTVEILISAEKQLTITTYFTPTFTPTSSTTHPTPTPHPTTNPTIPHSSTSALPPPAPYPPLNSTTKTGISIGSSLGFLTLLLVLFSIHRYLKHKQRSRQMHAANVPPLLPSSAVEEAEKPGSQQVGSSGYGTDGAAQKSKEEQGDGLASLHELGGVSAPEAPRELSAVSIGEGARGGGVRFVVGRTELA